MQLAKPAVDVGLSTNRRDEHLDFWRRRAGLAIDARLPIAPGHEQLRFVAGGSIVKVNCFDEPLPHGPAAGYREVLLARDGLERPIALEDPDGALLTLVPRGHEGVRETGMRIGVRDLARHRRFYAEALGLAEEQPGRFRAGESLFLLEQDDSGLLDLPSGGAGWRYVTFQVFKADEEHARALAKGAREARPPATLGDVARFSIIRDPDGNAIELSQRASIVGSLD